jgi:hypothetical protein
MGKTKINQKQTNIQTNITVPNPLLFENADVEDNGGYRFTIDNQEKPIHHLLQYSGGSTWVEVHLNQVDDFVLCSLCVHNQGRYDIEIDFVSDTVAGNNNTPLYTIELLPRNGRMCIMYMKIKEGIFIWPGVIN